MRSKQRLYEQSVFLNVPFDRKYGKLFDALVFAIHDCGFMARCALEFDDGADIRFDKLVRIIQECRYGVHDISRTTLDGKTRLPRFNMPLELGLFLGARRFGVGMQRNKVCLILERDRYRYQQFCSDISGQDVRAHNSNAEGAIAAVRNWLQAARPSVRIPGSSRIRDRYLRFRAQLPSICRAESLDPSQLTFVDYRTLAVGWLQVNQTF
jgi:hypothetical protein